MISGLSGSILKCGRSTVLLVSKYDSINPAGFRHKKTPENISGVAVTRYDCYYL
jgi:hypothetical protein